MPIFLLTTSYPRHHEIMAEGGWYPLNSSPFDSFACHLPLTRCSFMSDIKRLVIIQFSLRRISLSPVLSVLLHCSLARGLSPTRAKNTKGLLSKRWFVCLILIIRVSMQILLIIPEEMVDSNWIATSNHSAGKRRLTSCERVRVTLNRIRSVEKGKDHLRRYRGS